MAPRPAVVVFTKAPVAGRAKTRLIPTLGARSAAELYRCFVLDILSRVSDTDADVIVAAAGPDDVEAVRALAAESCARADVICQVGDSLGERMANAIGEALARGHGRALVLGTDSPDLPVGRVEEALRLARERDLVLGPSFDGGYYLVAMGELRRPLFEGIPWSSEDVLAETLRRASELELSVGLLEPWYDVDTPEDLGFLRQHLTARRLVAQPMPCPRTWEYLTRLSEAVNP